MAEFLYGRNAVRECLRARRRFIHRLLLVKGLKPSNIIQEILHLAQTQNILTQEVSKNNLNNLGYGHQGIAIEVEPLPEQDIETALEYTQDHQELPFLLALDHLEDPQNLGALLRTAESVGVHGIILPNRRAAKVTAAAVNASAGAAEHLFIITVSNLVQTLEMLKKKGLWIVGVENIESAQMYNEIDLNLPITLVLGSEGKGLSRLAQKTCDLLVKIPMRGKVESLNVSVAGALMMYEVWRSRQFYK